MQRLKILFAANAVPRPDKDSAERRMLALLKILALKHEVTVFSTEPEEHFERGVAVRKNLNQLGISRVVAPRSELVWLLGQNEFDVLFCEYWHVAEFVVPLFRRANPKAAIVMDTVDLEYVRLLAGAELGVGTQEAALETKRRELAIYAAADVVVNITSEDDELFRRELPGKKTTIIRNVVDIRPRPTQFRDKTVFFVGNLQHHPNIDGILWFCRSVWPIVQTKVPGAVLEIAGRNPPEELSAFNEKLGIRILGFVPKTEPYLDKAAVVIAPLRFGGGMKGKVSEAVASGAPVVTTPYGAQGFGAVDGVHMRILADESAMADAVSDLLNDPAKAEQLGLTGQKLLADLCSPETAAKSLDQTLTLASSCASGRAGSPTSRYLFRFGLKVFQTGNQISQGGWRLMGRPPTVR